MSTIRPLAAALKVRTGALVLCRGAAPRRAAAASGRNQSARRQRRHGLRARSGARRRASSLEGDGWAFEAIHTPGHTANHCVFALQGTGIVFSADHVMAWATSIVAPPDGAMADYMASLDRMLERDDRLYLPGHGARLEKPKPFLRGLKAHRKMRERADHRAGAVRRPHHPRDG